MQKREITIKGKIIQEIRLNDQSRVYCVLSNKLRLLCVNIVFKAVLLKSGRPHPKPSQLLLCSELVIKQNICFSCTWISHHLSCCFFHLLSPYMAVVCVYVFSHSMTRECNAREIHLQWEHLSFKHVNGVLFFYAF